MPLSIARWVFQSNQERTQEENERWWQECYTPSPIDAVLQSQPRWQIIVGGAGSGKSTVLTALERQMRERALILRYLSEFFPNAKQILKRGSNHRSQRSAATISTNRQRFDQCPSGTRTASRQVHDSRLGKVETRLGFSASSTECQMIIAMSETPQTVSSRLMLLWRRIHVSLGSLPVQVVR